MKRNLVTPLLNDDPKFSAGVEFGMLYCEIRESPDQISGYYHKDNEDRICVLASRLKYSVEMESYDEFWTWICLRRKNA